MAFDATHKKCIIATLATVEASGDYGIISAPDTLSLGIGQWTQGRAYDLLKRFPSGTSFGGTVDGWLAEGKDSWTIGARKYQYLSGADRSALSGALDSADGHRIQNAQMLEDLESSYIPRCQELGLDPEAETEACMLLIVVMHQYGNYARVLGRIVAGAGHPATLDSMANSIKYEGVWGQYPNRYETAYDMISRLDTNGVELNPGDDQNHDANAAADKEKQAKKIKHVTLNRDGTLNVVCNDGSRARCYPTGSGEFWKASSKGQDKGSPGQGGGGGGGGGPVGEGIKAMTKLAWDSIGKFEYHQWYDARLHPDQTGVTDCSGFCWWLYMTCCNIDIGSGGTSQIYGSSTGWVVASGSGPFDAADQVREGDLVVCRWYSGGGHIEYCTGGDGGWESIGARGPDGHPEPNVGSLSMFGSCSWELRRYVE